MKTINELITQYVNRENRPRVLGRYNSSEIYSIIKGYVKPKDLFEKKSIEEYGCQLISEGVAIEDYLTRVFETMKVPVEPQAKTEIKINDEITLVAKPDYLFKNFIGELKRPQNLSDEIPEKWCYQLESYYRGFGLPVYLWQVSYPINITQLRYTPSDARWEKIKVELEMFHSKVVSLNNKAKVKLKDEY